MPTAAEIKNAANKTLNDVIGPNLCVLFCGINPGLYSAAVGHNFARPGNRFWSTLYQSGFTHRLLRAEEEYELLHCGIGITNIVNRATASAGQLNKEELVRGGNKLIKKVRRYKPRYLAVVGVSAFRVAFKAPKAQIGLQDERIEKTIVWVLPNPSGLNAHFQLPDLVIHFKELRSHLGSDQWHREPDYRNK
jgi:TDG/mug DNA glycosylase family protein